MNHSTEGGTDQLDPCALTDILFRFFTRFIAADAEAENVVATHPNHFALTDGRLCFTLSGLYQLAWQQNRVDFVHFKRLLYAGSLNARLSEIGYRVSNYSSAKTLELSWYQLERL